MRLSIQIRKLLALAACILLAFGTAIAEDPADTEETPAAQSVDFGEKFADKFLSEGENTFITETSYQSQNLYIEISSFRQDNSDVYVADIYVRSLSCLQRGFGGGVWKKKQESVKKIAQNYGAVLALTGDNSQNFTAGWVVANGDILRKTKNSKRDLCLIYNTGEMVTLKAADIDHQKITEEMDQLWQSFLFGPVLLDENGKSMEKFNTNVGVANPRAVIGYYEPGHYCLVQIDGRKTKSKLESGKYNLGMTMKQTSALMEQLGCTAAYNLDGGQSALMWFDGSVVSNPYKGGRSVMDAVLIVDVSADASADASNE